MKKICAHVLAALLMISAAATASAACGYEWSVYHPPSYWNGMRESYSDHTCSLTEHTTSYVSQSGGKHQVRITHKDSGGETKAQTLSTDECVSVTDYGYAPGCLTSGLTDGSHCALCRQTLVKQTSISPTGHTKVTVPEVPPTCTENGKTAGQYCSVCGVVILEQTEIPLRGHNIQSMNALPATCTTPGRTAGKACTVCGYSEEVTQIPAFGHTEIREGNGKPVTCTEDGWVESVYCDTCKDVLVKHEVIPAQGHSLHLDRNIYEMKVGESAGQIAVEIACGHQVKLIPAATPELTMAGGEDGCVTVYPQKPGAAVLSFTADDRIGNSVSCQIIVHAENPMVLPAELTTIEEEAVANSAAEEIVVGDQVEHISANAFADCENLALITLPDDVQIAEKAFDGCNQLTILCSEESTGYAYAKESKIPYVVLSMNDSEAE